MDFVSAKELNKKDKLQNKFQINFRVTNTISNYYVIIKYVNFLYYKKKNNMIIVD